jgi:hypothetical protein
MKSRDLACQTSLYACVKQRASPCASRLDVDLESVVLVDSSPIVSLETRGSSAAIPCHAHSRDRDMWFIHRSMMHLRLGGKEYQNCG